MYCGDCFMKLLYSGTVYICLPDNEHTIKQTAISIDCYQWKNSSCHLLARSYTNNVGVWPVMQVPGDLYSVHTMCIGCYLKWKPHHYGWPWEDILWEQWVMILLLVILPSWDALWSCMSPNRCTFLPSAYLKFSQPSVKSFCVVGLWVCVDGIMSDASEISWNLTTTFILLTCFKWILHFHRLKCECKTCLMRKVIKNIYIEGFQQLKAHIFFPEKDDFWVISLNCVNCL